MSNNQSVQPGSKLESLKESPEATAKCKGERLRRVRHLANLSREAFCESNDINITTLISWEVGRFGGLSSKGASKVIARVADEGVFCTIEWLLCGVGAGPEVRVDYKKSKKIADDKRMESGSIDEVKVILEELMLFRRHTPHSTDYIVDDEAMMPYYQIGDYVAGSMFFGDDINRLFGINCIIHTKDGRLLVRQLQHGPSKFSYNLIPTNFTDKVKDIIVYDVQLTSAAPIIWHRRKQSFK